MPHFYRTVRILPISQEQNGFPFHKIGKAKDNLSAEKRLTFDGKTVKLYTEAEDEFFYNAIRKYTFNKEIAE